MTATITATGGGTTSPTEILGYETQREGRNIVHDLISGGIAVALIAPRPRSGTLELFYAAREADAWACLALHAIETTFVVTDTDRPSIGMTYVLNGAAGLTLDPETRDLWIVSIPYQEIVP